MKTIILIISLFAAVQSCGEMVSPNVRPDEIHPGERYYIEGCIVFEIKPNLKTHTTIPYSLVVYRQDGKDEYGGELSVLQQLAAREAGKCR